IIRSPESSQGAVLACSGLVAGVALGAALSLVLAQRRAAARLRMLARAEPVVEPGLWGALDGRVESGSYKRTRVHTLERYVQEDADGRTRTQRWWTYEDTVKASDFKITLDDGSTLKVEVKGAVLAAVDSWQEKTRLIEQIASGDRIRVVGRPARENERWTMRSTGVDSLLILATRQ